jgi:hypothetical protein
LIVQQQLILDEAGMGQTGPDEAFIFAGYLGTVRAWESFMHKWVPLLKHPRPLSAGGFKNLVRRKRRNKDRLRGFVSVIKECRLHRVSVTIPRIAYENAILVELPQWERRGLDADAIKLIRNEYFFGFWAVAMHVLLPMSWTNDQLRLEIIYDLNVQEVEKLKQGYRDFQLTVPEERFLKGEPHGETDDDFMPLLAADMIAWHIHRDYVETQLGRIYQDPIWNELKALSTYPPMILDESDLRSMARWEYLDKVLPK